MIIAFAVVFISNHVIACSCSEGSFPLDQQEAIIHSAKMKAGLGMWVIVEDKDIKITKSYPTLWEKMNLGGFKGTSCETFGPNKESHFYCSTTFKAKYDVIVRNNKSQCTVNVMAKSNTRTVKATAIKKKCESI